MCTSINQSLKLGESILLQESILLLTAKEKKYIFLYFCTIYKKTYFPHALFRFLKK